MKGKLIDIDLERAKNFHSHSNYGVHNDQYGMWKKDDSGKPKFYAFGSAPIVKNILIDLESGEMFLKLIFYNVAGQGTEITMPRSDMTEQNLLNLVKFGIQVEKKSAKVLLYCLENQESQAEVIYCHGRTGFGFFNGREVFKGSVVTGVNSDFTGDIKIMPQGSAELWVQMVREEVLGSPMEVILASALSAPVIDFLQEVYPLENILFSLVGDSSSGKTTALILAVSAGARPSATESSLMLNFLDTENSIMKKLSDASGFPVGIDEASTYSKNSTRLLYSIANGKERSRLKKDLTAVETAEFHTSVFMSSERSILSMADNNSGLRVRVMEMSNIIWTKSGSSSDSIKRKCLQNYGWAIPMVADHLLHIDKAQLADRCMQLSAEYLDSLEQAEKENPLIGRLSKKIGVILATTEIAEKVFGFSFRVQAMKDLFTQTLLADPDEFDIGIKAYELILAYYTENPKEFGETCNENARVNETYYKNGLVKWKKEKTMLYDGTISRSILYIKRETFQKILSQNSFTDCNVVLRRLKELGLLIYTDNRYVHRFKLGANDVVVTGYRLRIRNDSQEVKEEQVEFRRKKTEVIQDTDELDFNNEDESEEE